MPSKRTTALAKLALLPRDEVGRLRRGRPSKLTPALQRRFVSYMERGLFLEDACALVGVAPATFYNWVQRGEAGEQPFLDFLEAVRAAEARPRVAAMEVIRKRILGDPGRGQPTDANLASKWLAQRWPKQFRTAVDEQPVTANQYDADRAGLIVRFADPEHRRRIREVLDLLTIGHIDQG